MALYKEHLLNKIEDDLAGRNNNWGALDNFIDTYNDHISSQVVESSDGIHGLRTSSDRLEYFNGTSWVAVAPREEYGTWNDVTIEGETTLGTPTYTQRQGRFVRIGNLVVANFYVQIPVASLGGMAGNILITALPFPMTYSSWLMNTGKIGLLNGVTVNASTYQFSLISPGSSIQGFRVICWSGSGNVYLQASHATGTNLSISGQFVYQCPN